MNKKILILVMIVPVTAITIYASSSIPSETANLDMGRTHGTISTSMGSPFLGNPSAPITIMEFGDYQCHQCYNWYHDTNPSISRDYVETGNVSFVFMDLAFLGNDSPKAAQASYCAEDQGMYWDYHNLLSNSQEPEIDESWVNSERLKAFAFSLGLDMDLFDICLDSGKYSKRVQYNVQQAHVHDVKGTPGFFIVGPDGQQQIDGAQPFSVFKQILDPMI